VDGDQVAYATGRPGLTPLSLLPSASVSKTVTAVGVGKAVCSGRVTLNSALGSLIPGLKAAPIGTASLRDALLMASGSAVHSHEITPAETSQHFAGPGSLELLLLTPRFAELSASPGQRFVYKSIDPYLAAMAVQAVMGKPFSQFLQDEVFTPMGSGEAVILDTDRQGHFLATGGVRMSLADWIRFAAYVREQRAGSGCFADYLKAMSTAQLRIPKIPGVNGFFNGYGYFTWTDNDAAPGSVWAVGHFGQRIGWSTDPAKTRVFLTFGVESDRDMAALYPLAARWLRP
jgi:CubicO group peptidase (beta-lactamase class C family)